MPEQPTPPESRDVDEPTSGEDAADQMTDDSEAGPAAEPAAERAAEPESDPAAESASEAAARGEGVRTAPGEGAPAGGNRGRGRWIVLGVALALVIAGVGSLGYVAWEYWGTDYVAKQKQADIAAELRERWAHPTVGDVLGPAASAAPQGQAQALVRVPRFGTNYEVPLIEGVRDGDLAKGIGHFPGTGPGQIGNFAIAGHRVTHGEPFRDLPGLRPGDEVIIETSDATYTYRLDTNPNELVVPFTEGWVLDQVPVPPEGEAPPGMPDFDSPRPQKALITLTTCSELFHTDDRLVAFGHLVATVPKSL